MKFIRVKARRSDEFGNGNSFDNHLFNLDHIINVRDDKFSKKSIFIRTIDGKEYETQDYTIDSFQNILLGFSRNDVIDKLLTNE